MFDQFVPESEYPLLLKFTDEQIITNTDPPRARRR